MLFVYKSVIFHNVLLIIISDIVFPSLMYSHQNGATALINAAYNGHSEVVKLLLDARALIEAKNNVSNKISILTYVCVLYSSIIRVKYHIILLLYFITQYDGRLLPLSLLLVLHTHTHTHTYMRIWIFFYLHYSSLQLKPQLQVVV